MGLKRKLIVWAEQKEHCEWKCYNILVTVIDKESDWIFVVKLACWAVEASVALYIFYFWHWLTRRLWALNARRESFDLRIGSPSPLWIVSASFTPCSGSLLARILFFCRFNVVYCRRRRACLSCYFPDSQYDNYAQVISFSVNPIKEPFDFIQIISISCRAVHCTLDSKKHF